MAADRGIGDNGGPRLEKFTAKDKVDRIRQVLEMEITAHQKCVGVGIIVEADSDGVAAELSTKRLQVFASVSDRETVYRATRVLEERDVARSIKVKGKPNSYRVLPTKVIDAIVDAYNQTKTSPAAPDMGSPVEPDIPSPSKPDMGSPVKPDIGSPPTPDMVPSSPSKPDMGVGSHGTGGVGFAPTSGQNQSGFPRQQERKKEEKEREECGVVVNGVAINGPGFILPFAAIDIIADLAPMERQRARAIAEVCAHDWASNGTKPDVPMARVKAAIMSDFNSGKVRDARVEKASKVEAKESTRESIVRMAEQHEEKLRKQQGRRGL